MGTVRVEDPDGDVVAVIVVQLNGQEWTLSHAPVNDSLPMPRRWTVQALRQLADSIEREADEVGD